MQTCRSRLADENLEYVQMNAAFPPVNLLAGIVTLRTMSYTTLRMAQAHRLDS